MLSPRVSPGAGLTPTGRGWRFDIPAGPAGVYRLAQLDDYSSLSRGRFPLNAPTGLSLRCRVSPAFDPSVLGQPNPTPEENKVGRKWREPGGLPGTWGFGFWNDPFAFSFGLQGTARRLPTLPNAAWFFHASAQNHLSLQEHLPGNGFLAQSFRAPKIPALLLAPGLLTLPLLFSKTTAKWLRAAGGKIIAEDSTRLTVDPALWHDYHLSWQPQRVAFAVDGRTVFETATSPRGPLGLVLWIDNQFAAFTPEGKINAGTEANPVPAWMEISDLEIEA